VISFCSYASRTIENAQTKQIIKATIIPRVTNLAKLSHNKLAQCLLWYNGNGGCSGGGGNSSSSSSIDETAG